MEKGRGPAPQRWLLWLLELYRCHAWVATVENQKTAQESKPLSSPGLEDALGRTRWGGLDLPHTGNGVAQQHYHGEAVLGSMGEEVTSAKWPTSGFHSCRLWVPLWGKLRAAPRQLTMQKTIVLVRQPASIQVRVRTAAQHALWRQAGREQWAASIIPAKHLRRGLGRSSLPIPQASLAEHKTGSAPVALGSSCLPPSTLPLQPLPCPTLWFQGAVGIVALTIFPWLGGLPLHGSHAVNWCRQLLCQPWGKSRSRAWLQHLSRSLGKSPQGTPQDGDEQEETGWLGKGVPRAHKSKCACTVLEDLLSQPAPVHSTTHPTPAEMASPGRL